MSIVAAAFHRVMIRVSMPWLFAAGYPAPTEAKRAAYLSLAVVLLLANVIPNTSPPPPAPVHKPSPQHGASGGTALHLEPPAAPQAQRARPRNQLISGQRPSLPAVQGIPRSVLRAYRLTERQMHRDEPRCGVTVALLAAIGRVESNHARGGDVDRAGTTRHPILGPRLDGSFGFATIRDTDSGRYDGDSAWDRAVGPMQFIPSTWARWGTDGNGDGVASPHNLHDATLAAGNYLCAGDRDLRRPGDLRAAILSYNHSEQYLRVVLAWMRVYSGKAVAIPDAHGDQRADNAVSRRERTNRHQAQAAAPASEPQPREQDRRGPPGTVQPAAPSKPGKPPKPPEAPAPDDATPPIPELDPVEPAPLPTLHGPVSTRSTSVST